MFSLAWPLALAATLAAPDATTPAPDPLAAAQALVARVTPRVEEIRGLKFKRPVTVKIADAAAARAHFERRLLESTPEAEWRTRDAVFAQLGLMAPGQTLRAGLLSMLDDQARGYYDPGSDTFYLLEGAPGPAVEAIVAHELVHALDDQHYDIDRLVAGASDDDASTALAAVFEGSGTLVMAVYLAQEVLAGRVSADVYATIQAQETDAAARLEASAPLLRRTLTAPYLAGLGFLLRGNLARLARGVDARDLARAMETPPRSTEQVLHPAKYWDPAARDEPRTLELPDLSARLGPGWRLAGEGRLGELLLGVLVDAPTPGAFRGMDGSSWTSPAAAGAQGDLWQHYDSGHGGVTLLATVWDTLDDAREFLNGLVVVHGRNAYRHDEAVLLVAGAEKPLADELAAQALGALATAR